MWNIRPRVGNRAWAKAATSRYVGAMFRHVLLPFALCLVGGSLSWQPQAWAHERHADHVHLTPKNVAAVLKAVDALFPDTPRTRLSKRGPSAELLRWLAREGQWDRSDSAKVVSKALKTAGFKLAKQEEWATVERFEDALLAILNAYDANASKVSQAQIDAAYKRLSALPKGDRRLKELRWTISLASVTEEERRLVAPHKAAIGTLLRRAGRAQ